MSGQKSGNNFVGILEEVFRPKGHSEINWPLVGTLEEKMFTNWVKAKPEAAENADMRYHMYYIVCTYYVDVGNLEEKSVN